MKKVLTAVLLAGVVALTATACTSTTSAGQKAAKQSVNSEQESIANGLKAIEKTQPLPRFNYSQLRQNLIEIQTAQAQTTQTTSFFFNLGVQNPTQVCPSIGFPIASTTQLSNPEQKITDVGRSNGSGNVVLPQIDPNGVYSGQSTGTYVMCLNAEGKAYAAYDEGTVKTVTGPATWNEATHQIELTGPPSFNFSEGK